MADRKKTIQRITIDWNEDQPEQPEVSHSSAHQTFVNAPGAAEICIRTAAGSIRIDADGTLTLTSNVTGSPPAVYPLAGNSLKVQM